MEIRLKPLCAKQVEVLVGDLARVDLHADLRPGGHLEARP